MTSQKPTDRRTRRSRAALETALLDLIAERELTQISVSDVTGRADIHRTTFYEHYTDVHDLAACAGTQMFDQFVTATSTLTVTETPTEEVARHTLTEIFAHIAEHRPLYQSLLGAEGSARVINHLLERTTSAVHAGLTRAETDHPGDLQHGPAAFVAGGLLGTITDWLRRDCPESPEQLSARIWTPLIAATTARNS